MNGVEMSRSNVKRPPKYKPELKTKIRGRPKNIRQMETKGAFLVERFSNCTRIEALIVDGRYTDLAWSACEVGERPPKNLNEAQLLAQKGQRYLDRVFRMKLTK